MVVGAFLHVHIRGLTGNMALDVDVFQTMADFYDVVEIFQRSLSAASVQICDKIMLCATLVKEFRKI